MKSHDLFILFFLGVVLGLAFSFGILAVTSLSYPYWPLPAILSLVFFSLGIPILIAEVKDAIAQKKTN